jgi:hypothetical protein
MTGSVEGSLLRAGERWRAGQVPAPEPDRSRWVPRPAPARRWVPAVAAAAATIVAAGTVSAYLYDSRRGDVTDPVAVTEAAELVVREGDLVQATGMVRIAPGRPARFCAPAPTSLMHREGTEEAPGCTHGIPVENVDADRLSQIAAYGTVRTGFATLTGVWRSGVLQVTRQSAPAAPPAADPGISDPAACPTPAEGWEKGEPDEKTLFEYVEEEHPDRFRAPHVIYPGAGSEPSADSGDRVMVIVVELVDGDLGREHRELTRRYTGNLCLVPAFDRPSLADQIAARERVSERLDRLLRDPESGVYGLGGDDVATVDMVMLTPSLYDRLAPIGFGALRLNPWLRPAR